MNNMHPNGSAQSCETPVPCCLGRVVNLFDLTSGITGNKLLSDKPHRDVSLLSRSRSDISRMTSPTCEEIEDKMIDSDLRSSSAKKSEGTPVKNLIAQEMSRSLESRHSSPNVVAKLMGLDALPREQHLPDFGHGKRYHSRNSYSEIPVGYWRQEDEFIHGEVNCENHHHKDQHNYTDIYEIWQPSPQASNLRSESPRNGRCNHYTNEEKMALVRQKFMEAKRFSTDEKLRQTKEFQDALEVLSSNQDLFLKVLQEPDSLISGHFIGQQQIPPPLGTKRITVLKPSKMVSGSGKQFRKSPTREQTSGKDNHHYRFSPSVATWKAEECPSQPTRIVVLKPSPGRNQEGKAVPSSTLPINLRQAELFEKPGDDEAQEAMDVAKEITQKLRENLAGHRRDETLLSSVFSYGYTGDESSFNKSEAEVSVGNLSDSEVMSPASRHSWDYVSQYGSPYSCSSFSHASYSPESSVCQEAKKRLSERWAMVASNGTGGERRHVHRSSSTLGEMLALSDVTKSEIFEVEDSKRDQESRASTSCLTSNTREGEIKSPQSLMRSKSLPAASGQRFTLERDFCRTAGLKQTLKQMTKSSFRGKVTSLFFSRIMKSSKKNIGISPTHDKAQFDSAENLTSPAQFERPHDRSSKCSISEEVLSPNDSRQGISFKQGALSVLNPSAAVKRGDNEGQPNSISVLEPMLEDDGKIINGSLCSTLPNELGKQFSLGKSNLIDKSPPIGSVPRMLSQEEPCTDTATSKGGAAGEEEEWLLLVRSLLSAASLENLSKLSWHSPESPLDPLLRDEFTNPNMAEPTRDAKCRHLRSIRHLVYDCVNASLVDMAGPMGAVLEDRVWSRMKEWLNAGSCEMEAMWGPLEEDGGDGSCLVADRASRKEVMGKGWDDERKVEVENLVKEIEGKLMEDMVEEYVVGESLEGHWYK